MAADGARTDGRLLRLADVAGRGGDTDLVGRRCRARPEDHTLLPAAPAVRAACGGIRAAGRGAGAPAGRGAAFAHEHRGHRHHAGDRRLGLDAGTRLPARPHHGGQGGGRIVHRRPLRRPDRTGGIRGRGLHAEPPDHRPGDVADPVVAHPQRPDRRRHGDRQRPGNGDQPPARERPNRRSSSC